MAVRKDDPMYYRNKVKDLIKEAQDNGLKHIQLERIREKQNMN